MAAPMIRVKTDKLQAGMVVAADVANMDGMLLMPAGCEISERHLRILRTWGIPEVAIEGAEGADGSASSLQEAPLAATPEQVERMIARFWSFNRENPVHQEILRLLLRRQSRTASV